MSAESSDTPVTSSFNGRTYGKCNIEGCACEEYCRRKRKNAKPKCLACGHLPAHHENEGEAVVDGPTYPLEANPLVRGSYTHIVPYVKDDILKRVGKIKSFSGEGDYSVSRYFLNIQNQTAGMKQGVTLAILILNLHGTAKKWYNRLPYEYRATKEGIAKLKEDLEIQFPANSEHLYHARNVMKQFHPDKQSFKNFLLSFEESAAAIELTEKQLKSFLIVAILKSYPGDTIALEQLDYRNMTGKINKKFKTLKKKTRADPKDADRNKDKKKQRCKFFGTSAGCRKGDVCPFDHSAYITTTTVESEQTSEPVITESLTKEGDETELKNEPGNKHPKRDEEKEDKPEASVDKGLPNKRSARKMKRALPKKNPEQKEKHPTSSVKQDKVQAGPTTNVLNQAPKLRKRLTWEEARAILIGNMDPEFRADQELLDMLDEHQDCFDLDPFCGGVSDMIEPIVLKLKKPIPPSKGIKAERIPQAWLPGVQQIEQSRRENGITQASNSKIISKTKTVMKSDGTLRPTINFVRVNHYLEPSHTPLPLISDIVNAVKGHKLYCEVDASSYFSQLLLHENSRYLTAYIDPTTGEIREFRSLPQGLSVASQEAQRVTNKIYGKIKNLKGFIDNLSGFANERAAMMATLREMFRRTRKYKVKWQPIKCYLFVRRSRCLGYGVSEEGSTVDTRMLENIMSMSPPDNPKTLLAHLSLFSFSRDYIKNLGKLDAALRPFTKNWAGWGGAEIEVWEEIRKRFLKAPPLSPIDWERPFCLQTDGSGLGWGAVLLQPSEKIPADRDWKPNNQTKDYNIVGFASGAMKKEGMSYGATKGELFALKQATKKFDTILRGRKFHVQCDCQALVKGIDNIRGDFLGYMAIWAAELRTRYDFSLEYVPGPQMVLADAFSRIRNRPGTQETVNSTIKEKAEGSTKEQEEIIELPEFMNKLNKEDIKRGQQQNMEMIRHISDKQMIEGIYFKENKLIVPEKIQNLLIEAIHKVHKHPGTKETVRRIKEQYYFPKMEAQTREWIKSCKTCQEFNVNNQRKKTNMKKTWVSRPFQVLSIDPVPRDETSSGNRYLLVILDNFTKLVKLVPIKNREASTIGQAIKDNWIRYYVPPECICTDHDSSFASAEWRNFAAEHGFKHRPAAPKHQNSTGGVEPNWKSIKTIMAKIIDGRKEIEWDQISQTTEDAFNQRRHSTTKLSPYEAAFGSQTTDALNPIQGLVKKMAINKDIFSQLTKRDDAEKDVYHKFKVGDIIRFRNTSDQARKGFNRRNLGPYRISGLQGTELATIQEIPFGPRLNHLNRLQHANDLMIDTSYKAPPNPSGAQPSLGGVT
jgi:transposase InsO family protein